VRLTAVLPFKIHSESRYSLASGGGPALLVCVAPWLRVQQKQKRRSSNAVGDRFRHYTARALLVIATIEKRAPHAPLLVRGSPSQRVDQPDFEYGLFFGREACSEMIGHLASVSQTRDFPKKLAQLGSHRNKPGKIGSQPEWPVSVAETEY